MEREYIEVIKESYKLHCARGPKWCAKCKELIDEGPSYSLMRVYLEPGKDASPITEILVDGKKIWGEYDIIERFETEKEAKDYALKNGIDLI